MVIEQWGSWLDTDPEHGNKLVINGSGVYEVEFGEGGRRPVNVDSLVSARALPADGQELARQISHRRLFV